MEPLIAKFSRMQADMINKLYQEELGELELRDLFKNGATGARSPFTPLERIQDGDRNLQKLLSEGFSMVRHFDEERNSSYFKAVAFGFVEKLACAHNKNGLDNFIKQLNQEDPKNKLFTLKWDSRFDAILLDEFSKQEVERFVGPHKDGRPVIDELTKYLKFLHRELESIEDNIPEECFMICQRLFFSCQNQFFFECLDFFMRKIVANFLLYHPNAVIDGLPVAKAVLKSLRINSLEEHVRDVVMNFKEDGQGITLKILPVLLKLPIDVYFVGNGPEEEDQFLKFVEGPASYTDFSVKVKVEQQGVQKESKDLNFHDHRPLTLLQTNDRYCLLYKGENLKNGCGFGEEALQFDQEFSQKVGQQMYE